MNGGGRKHEIDTDGTYLVEDGISIEGMNSLEYSAMCGKSQRDQRRSDAIATASDCLQLPQKHCIVTFDSLPGFETVLQCGALIFDVQQKDIGSFYAG